MAFDQSISNAVMSDQLYNDYTAKLYAIAPQWKAESDWLRSEYERQIDYHYGDYCEALFSIVPEWKVESNELYRDYCAERDSIRAEHEFDTAVAETLVDEAYARFSKKHEAAFKKHQSAETDAAYQTYSTAVDAAWAAHKERRAAAFVKHDTAEISAEWKLHTEKCKQLGLAHAP